MKKGIALGLLATASLLLFGCQQKPAQPTTQQETSTASIKITESQEGEAQTSKATLEIKPAEESMMKEDGVLMKEGVLMMVKGGVMTKMSEDVMMENGSKVTMDGKVMMKDGTSVMMKEGQMMTMDGEMKMTGEAATEGTMEVKQ